MHDLEIPETTSQLPPLTLEELGSLNTAVTNYKNRLEDLMGEVLGSSLAVSMHRELQRAMKLRSLIHSALGEVTT